MYIGESEQQAPRAVREGPVDRPRRCSSSTRSRRSAASASTPARRPRRSWSASSSPRWTASPRTTQGVLILGATNVPWAVDPAFRRPGRFDRVLFVPPPDRRRPPGDPRDPARRPPGGRGSRPRRARPPQLRLLGRRPREPGRDRRRRGDRGLDRDRRRGADPRRPPARAALDEVKPTTLEWLTTARNYARYANEAGHYDEVLDFLKKHGRGG